ncbi:MAG TPA: sugar transferase [Planctomycetota bacterium]|jgi:exopolysaccharide biosynthesis polyprenyl glycosylphosphotransferase
MREGRKRTQALLLALSDTLMLLLAMQLAWWLRFDVNDWMSVHLGWNPFMTSWGWTPKQPYVLAVLVALPIFWLILREMRLYDEPEDGTGEFLRLCAAVFVATVLLTAISFYVRVRNDQEQFQFSRAYSLLLVPCSIVCLSAGRGLFRKGLRTLSRSGIGQHRILFVGTGPLAEDLARALAARGTNHIVGTLATGPVRDEAPALDANSVFRLKVLGEPSNLVDLAGEHSIDEVVVAIPDAPQPVLKQLAEDCYRAHVRFRMVPDVYEMLLDHMDLSLVGDIPLLGMRGSRIEGINYLSKRLFDILVSGLLLALLMPLLIVSAIWIKLSDRGPALYFQERIGYRRSRFRFWKFRTMRVGADSGDSVQSHRNYLKKYIAGSADGAKDAKGRTIYKITDDPRVTKIGRFLRQFSIDELPQLWNVLRGDMSLIGPRPPVSYEVENYRPIHLRRFEVLPGISGLWQVSGRNELTFEEMVKLDLYYIENWSLELDLRILAKTVQVVLFQRAH